MLKATKFAIAAMATALSAPAMAGTIFDTGQPDDSAGYSIFANQGIDQAIGAQFTLSGLTRITDIQARFGRASAGANQVLFTLHNDDAASGPGSVIAAQNITLPGFDPGGPFDNIWQSGFNDGSTLLSAGNYWISFSVDPNNANRCACLLAGIAPIPIAVGAYRNEFTGGNWRERDLVFGLRIYGDAVAGAVPEPASWALMILGFGAVGAALRRPKRRLTLKAA